MLLKLIFEQNKSLEFKFVPCLLIMHLYLIPLNVWFVLLSLKFDTFLKVICKKNRLVLYYLKMMSNLLLRSSIFSLTSSVSKKYKRNHLQTNFPCSDSILIQEHIWTQHITRYSYELHDLYPLSEVGKGEWSVLEALFKYFCYCF